MKANLKMVMSRFFIQLYAYLRLFRWQNLIVIILAMVLVRYYLIRPLLISEGYDLQMPFWIFCCLVISILLLAAAGYVINDYFDIRIDQLNKGEDIILDRYIPVTYAIPLHAVMTASGIGLGLMVSIMTGNFKLVFIHLLAGLLLWLYSARYKRKPFWGNMVVAFLSALVLGVSWLFEVFAMTRNGVVLLNRAEYNWVSDSIIFLAAFAFLVTLIREMIKDVEDMEGDKRYGCRTLPVVIGIPAVRWICVSLTILSMAGLLWVQIHLYGTNYKLTSFYFAIIQFMMAYMIYKTIVAKEKDDYDSVSQLARIIMVAGILSLQIYNIDHF